tara:strand:+ start:813 stop:1454 length:642 start_codon:yes stop_codon:yes gene_type:complete
MNSATPLSSLRIDDEQTLLTPQQQLALIERTTALAKKMTLRLTPDTNKAWQLGRYWLPLISKQATHGHKPSLSALLEVDNIIGSQDSDTWSDTLLGWLSDAGLDGINKAEVLAIDSMNDTAENEEIEQAIATASPLARYIWADINPNAIMTYAYQACSKTMLQRLWVLDSKVIDIMVDNKDFSLSDFTAAERALMMALSNSQHDVIKALASQS